MGFVSRLIGWTLGIVLAVFAIMLMIGSREMVDLQLALVPGSLQLPLFAAVLAAAVVGFFCGAVVMWFSQGRWRSLARDEMADVEELQRENAALKAELAEIRAAADRADSQRAMTSAGNDNAHPPLLPGRAL